MVKLRDCALFCNTLSSYPQLQKLEYPRILAKSDSFMAIAPPNVFIKP